MNTLFDLPDRLPLPDDYRPQLRQMHRDYGIATNGAVCGGCAHLQKRSYHNATYFKCTIFGESRGPGTDWRKSWPACGAVAPDAAR